MEETGVGSGEDVGVAAIDGGEVERRCRGVVVYIDAAVVLVVLLLWQPHGQLVCLPVLVVVAVVV